jgi:hypothetical protein
MPRPYTKGLRSTVYNRKKVETARATIDAERMLNLLQENALGLKQLDAIQQRSIEICLRKSLPDLSAVEVSNEGAQAYALLPAAAPNADAWHKAFAPHKPTEGATAPKPATLGPDTTKH